jgi:hypothetical protein
MEQLSPEDAALLDELERDAGMRPIDLTQQREQRAWAAHKATLNQALAQGSPRTVKLYAVLRERTARLQRLLELRAPSQLLARECGLIRTALDHIDPSWRELAPLPSKPTENVIFPRESSFPDAR